MIEIPMIFKIDEKGYFDRECPNKDCKFNFKINMEDWEGKVSDEEVHCPKCGYVSDASQRFTEKQIENIEKIATSFAMSYVETELDKSFKRLEGSTRNNKYFRITYKPNMKTTFVNNPIGASGSWKLEIKCENCGTRYSVIGTAYFCPCCGYNSIDHIFENSLITIENMVKSTDELRELLDTRFTKDETENMINSMIENGFTDLVSAFQNYMFRFHSRKGEKNSKPNDFQVIEKGNDIFRRDLGFGYDDILNKVELDRLHCDFQQRHIIEHNGGIIDRRYLEKVPKSVYKLNQRIIIKEDDVLDMLRFISLLVSEIKNQTN